MAALTAHLVATLLIKVAIVRRPKDAVKWSVTMRVIAFGAGNRRPRSQE
jgi:hypothetical protein